MSDSPLQVRRLYSEVVSGRVGVSRRCDDGPPSVAPSSVAHQIHLFQSFIDNKSIDADASASLPHGTKIIDILKCDGPPALASHADQHHPHQAETQEIGAVKVTLPSLNSCISPSQEQQAADSSINESLDEESQMEGQSARHSAAELQQLPSVISSLHAEFDAAAQGLDESQLVGTKEATSYGEHHPASSDSMHDDSLLELDLSATRIDVLLAFASCRPSEAGIAAAAPVVQAAPLASTKTPATPSTRRRNATRPSPNQPSSARARASASARQASREAVKRRNEQVRLHLGASARAQGLNTPASAMRRQSRAAAFMAADALASTPRRLGRPQTISGRDMHTPSHAD